MARESFLLRTDPELLDALKRWAGDELRSANGQLEYVLRDALRRADRLPKPKPSKKAKSRGKESNSKDSE